MCDSREAAYPAARPQHIYLSPEYFGSELRAERQTGGSMVVESQNDYHRGPGTALYSGLLVFRCSSSAE